MEGGKFWRAAEAREALADCARSGETVAAFARRHGLSAKRLYWWRRRLRKQRTVQSGETRLIPLMLRPEPIEPPPTKVAVTEGGLRVEVGDASAVSPAWIAALLRLTREGVE